MIKRHRQKYELVFLLFFLYSFFSPCALRAATEEEDRVAKLVEGAKAERELHLYSSTEVDDSMAWLKGFESKYPFIKTKLYRSGAQDLLTRILNEARAKRLQADVVVNGQMRQYVCKKEGIFQKYLPPGSKQISDELKDKDGYLTPIFLNPLCMAYNTRLVATKDIPKTYEDLLNPKWKGSVGMNNRDYEWFANMFLILGESRALDLMKKLSGQVNLRDSQSLLLQFTSAGEIPISITVYASATEYLKAKESPLEWLPLFPSVAQVQPVGVTAGASHPNAGKLFIDFLVSREGQEIIKSFHKVPTRTDVESAVLTKFKGHKIYTSNPILFETFQKYQDLFNEIFLKKRL